MENWLPTLDDLRTLRVQITSRRFAKRHLFDRGYDYPSRKYLSSRCHPTSMSFGSFCLSALTWLSRNGTPFIRSFLRSVFFSQLVEASNGIENTYASVP